MREEEKASALSILEEEPLLSTPEAVAWLKSKGIQTSRRSLDNARMAGRLNYLRVTGRVRILYRPSDLADAFLCEYVTHETLPQGRNDRTSRKINHVSPDEAFRRALELARASKGNSNGKARSPKNR